MKAERKTYNTTLEIDLIKELKILVRRNRQTCQRSIRRSHPGSAEEVRRTREEAKSRCSNKLEETIEDLIKKQ
jgi:hypothetical protein